MSGLTALVDTLLATRLAQRVDLVPLKPEIEIAGPGAVSKVEGVQNDVRLPSRAAVQQQLGVGLLQSGADNQAGSLLPRSDGSVTLSAAGRAVNAILDAPAGAGKIIGSVPLWTESRPPVAHLLGAALARTVASSGLFYEAHLAQFAAGTRSLEEMAQEPQAALNGSVKAVPASVNPSALPVAPLTPLTPLTPIVPMTTVPPAVPALPAVLSTQGLAGQPEFVPSAVSSSVLPAEIAAAPDDLATPMASAAARPQEMSVDQEPAGAARLQGPPVAPGLPGAGSGIAMGVPEKNATAQASATPAAGSSVSDAGLDMGTPAAATQRAGFHDDRHRAFHDMQALATSLKDAAPDTVDSPGKPVAGFGGIHADAATLVRQQLDLLATPVFRWAGEAWPGVPADWEVHEEADERQGRADGEALPSTWSTRMTLNLPTLKEVEIRLTLAGSDLQVHVSARERSTRDLLSQSRSELPVLIEELGLQLTGLQIATLSAAPPATETSGSNDAR